MWGTFITKNAEVCQEGWWWNLLYVQNYFGFEDMCAPQTHQLALDMQLTIIGCILVWLVTVKQGLYKILIPALHVIAAYSRYTTVRDHRLTMLAYHGVSVSQLYRTARLSYTSVLHRSTPYLIGLSLGLALKKPVEHGKFILGVGWLSSTALWFLVWWAVVDSGSLQYRYSASFAAQYAALAPIASALAIAWVIYAVHSSGEGVLSRFLCCRPLVLISRLSYALYLTQFIVFITSVATVKTSREFSLISEEAKESEDVEQQKEEKQEEKEEEPEVIEPQPVRSRQHLIAHREVLEEIPETEIEYEAQRDNEGLGEILEEEEEEIGEESVGNIEDDELEIIEEEGGEDEEDEAWLEREHYVRRRSEPRDDDQDLDEWEWTANGNRNGAQYYRYSR
ncbi:hypothetical protein SFRURICE_009332 [Spodoptera frugiperda]|nr:hypothetical protein SFRURICE_009332 [Spodoptera frugiperda]